MTRKEKTSVKDDEHSWYFYTVQNEFMQKVQADNSANYLYLIKFCMKELTKRGTIYDESNNVS